MRDGLVRMEPDRGARPSTFSRSIPLATLSGSNLPVISTQPRRGWNRWWGRWC